MRDHPGTISLAAFYLGLSLLVLVVFGQTAGFQFVNYDDGSYVYQNSHISSGVSWRNIAWAFTHVHSANWHPLTTLSHMLDCQLFGLNPRGPHLVNVLFHLGTTLFLFSFLRLSTEEVWASALASALFAIHPLRAESVAWISERKDVLSGFFFVLTLLSYFYYARRTSWRRYLLVVLSLTAGLMSKPMLVTTPLILLLLDYWPLHRQESRRQLLLEKVPFFLVVAGSVVATFVAQRLALGTSENLPLAWRLTNAAVSYLNYLRQMFWPADLVPFYLHPEASTSTILWVSSVCLLLAATIFVLLFRKRLPWLFTGWVWYLVMLLPVIGIVQVGLQARADRYTYLPQIGINLVVAWSLRLFVHVPWLRKTVAAAMIGGLSLLTFRQTSHWRDTESLWRYTLSKSPQSDVALIGLAGIQLVRGETEAARSNYERAIALRPGNGAAHHGLALALWKERKVDAAIEHWQKSLAVQPDNNEARDNLGTALAMTGRPAEAAAQWRQALAFDADDGNAANNLAWILATDPSLRNGEEATRLAEHAVHLPGGDNPVVYRTLGVARAEAGNFEGAVAAIDHVLDLAGKSNNSTQTAELKRLRALFLAHRPLRER